MNNKVIAITGGTGFVGKQLAEAFLKKNYEVRILTRDFKNKHNKIKYFYADLTKSTDKKVLTKFTKGVDILYHCSAELKDESKMRKLHVLGTKRLIKVSKNQVKKWVQLSSVGVYGQQNSNKINSNTLEAPKNLYEMTKYKSDEIVKKSGLKFVILRPSIIFGKNMPNQSLIKLINIIKMKLFFYIGKNVVVNYVHINDVVNALIICGEYKKALNKIYLLSDNIKIEKMIDSLSHNLKIKKPFLRFPEWIIRFHYIILGKFSWFPLNEVQLNFLTNHCIFDSTEIQNDLGFIFHSNLEKLFKDYAKSNK